MDSVGIFTVKIRQIFHFKVSNVKPFTVLLERESSTIQTFELEEMPETVGITNRKQTSSEDTTRSSYLGSKTGNLILC